MHIVNKYRGLHYLGLARRQHASSRLMSSALTSEFKGLIMTLNLKGRGQPRERLAGG
jgi:hypothetical protein